jgi:hypothetical protein
MEKNHSWKSDIGSADENLKAHYSFSKNPTLAKSLLLLWTAPLSNDCNFPLFCLKIAHSTGNEYSGRPTGTGDMYWASSCERTTKKTEPRNNNRSY